MHTILSSLALKTKKRTGLPPSDSRLWTCFRNHQVPDRHRKYWTYPPPIPRFFSLNFTKEQMPHPRFLPVLQYLWSEAFSCSGIPWWNCLRPMGLEKFSANEISRWAPFFGSSLRWELRKSQISEKILARLLCHHGYLVTCSLSLCAFSLPGVSRGCEWSLWGGVLWFSCSAVFSLPGKLGEQGAQNTEHHSSCADSPEHMSSL